MPERKVKQRPSVDSSVYDLAETWLENFHPKGGEMTEDLTWKLAGEIQNTIEDFISSENLEEN